MSYDFALDLRVARRKAALTQADCAHLLGVSVSRISKLEAGRRLPSVVEFSVMCLLFDRHIEGIQRTIALSVARSLEERLGTIPDCPSNWTGRRNRLATLNTIAEKLTALAPTDHE